MLSWTRKVCSLTVAYLSSDRALFAERACKVCRLSVQTLFSEYGNICKVSLQGLRSDCGNIILQGKLCLVFGV